MKRSMIQQRSTTRRGAVLIVVLAMLALFAVIGLSFVLYAESQANMADSNKRALNETGSWEAFIEVQPEQVAELWLGNLIYGVGDFDNELMNPLRGHSLAESKHGKWRAGANPLFEGQPSLFPFAGQAIPVEPGMFNVPGTGNIDRRNIVNYMWDAVNNCVVDPERYYNGALVRNTTSGALPGTYTNAAVPYTYPDRQANFFLALQDQITGEIVAPSFFRPDLFGSPVAFNSTVAPSQKLATVRPTRNNHPNFPAVPQNPDGTYTGDVQNMKFLNATQKNDSFWMDAGGPVLTIRGRKVKAMVAPLILDLSSKVNLSIAGNIRAVVPGTNPGEVPTGARHTSHDGIGPWEINPRTVAPNLTDPQFLALMQKRFPNPPGGTYVGTQIDQAAARPPVYARNGLTGTLNEGQLPPLHAGISYDGVTTTTSGTPDPMTLPLATQASLFPTFPGTRFPNSGSASPMLYTDRLYSHPHLFNPLLYRRGSNTFSNSQDKPFGLDNVVTHGVRVNDGKSRWASTEIGNVSPLPAANGGFNNLQDRLGTTGFNVSQQLPMLQINTGGQTTNLAPIDINRDLPDYRKNTQFPLSPLNIWNLAVPAEAKQFFKARQARQALARDIFIRLAAFATYDDPMTAMNDYLPAIDGTNVYYDVSTGYLFVPPAYNLSALSPIQTAQMNALRNMAQLAANMVDFIDHDDISTAFVWNPNITTAAWTGMVGTTAMDPSNDPANYLTTEIGYRTVFGTELPKLVLNEVYSAVANNRTDMGVTAMNPLKRRYYIELFNPMLADNTRPDSGATRLKYQNTTTQLQDPTAPPGTYVAYSGATFNPYQIEIATSAAFVAGTPQTPYSTALNNNPLIATADHVKVPVAGMTLQARIGSLPTSYTHDATAPAPTTNLMNDDINVVKPYIAGNLVQGLNNGFYVMGPRDPFTPTTTHSISLFDAATAPTPADPVDALTFDATPNAPTDAEITTEAGKTSVILLRRLMNPYIPYDQTSNPYITVDYLENIPTRDLAKKTNSAVMPHTPAAGQDTAGTQGRVHPFVAYPTYGSMPSVPGAINGVNDHVMMGGTPFHSMFAHNEFAQNDRTEDSGTTPKKGFEWMVHFDRKLINSMELLHVGMTSPAMLTQSFAINNPAYNGAANTNAFLYHYHTRAKVAGVTLPYLLDPVNAPNYYKLLDFLTCGNTLPGTPIGWREPGKMNPNGFTNPQPTLPAQTFLAVTDPQLGNNFTVANSTYTWMGSNVPADPGLHGTRTPNWGTAPYIRGTSDETNPSGDRPLKSLSSSAGFDETLLRGIPGTPSPGQYMSVAPLSFSTTHPYLQYEQLRKSWNNLTPVSDSFLVIMTVGYFEVENDVSYSVTNPPQIGKEVFNVTPGDLRVQFAGIVDRSNLVVPMDPGSGAIAPPGSVMVNEEPWSVKLVEDVHPGATSISVEAAHPGTMSPIAIGVDQFGVVVGGDMVLKTLTDPQFLRLGHGDGASSNGDAEVLPQRISITQRYGPNPANGMLDQPIPNQVTITFNAATPITRYHAAGSPLSNAILGNPGPQTLKPSLPKLKARNIVPYFTRIYP